MCVGLRTRRMRYIWLQRQYFSAPPVLDEWILVGQIEECGLLQCIKIN